MPVKYFAPRVTVKLCHWYFILEITVVKIMNNLNVFSAHSYVYPLSRYKQILRYRAETKYGRDIPTEMCTDMGQTFCKYYNVRMDYKHYNRRQKNPKGQSRMENLGTLVTLGTQYTVQRQKKTKQKTQHNTTQTTKTMRNTDRTNHRRWKQVLAEEHGPHQTPEVKTGTRNW
jgi:hypothetical protein